MSRRKRSPEEQARREKIRELLQTSGISSMEDIQNLFKETITMSLATRSTTTRIRTRTTAVTVTAAKRCAPASAMLRCLFRETERENLSRSF